MNSQATPNMKNKEDVEVEQSNIQLLRSKLEELEDKAEEEQNKREGFKDLGASGRLEPDIAKESIAQSYAAVASIAGKIGQLKRQISVLESQVPVKEPKIVAGCRRGTTAGADLIVGKENDLLSVSAKDDIESRGGKQYRQATLFAKELTNWNNRGPNKQNFFFKKDDKEMSCHMDQRAPAYFPEQCVDCKKTFANKGGLMSHQQWCDPYKKRADEEKAAVKEKEQRLQAKIQGARHKDEAVAPNGKGNTPIEVSDEEDGVSNGYTSCDPRAANRNENGICNDTILSMNFENSKGYVEIKDSDSEFSSGLSDSSDSYFSTCSSSTFTSDEEYDSDYLFQTMMPYGALQIIDKNAICRSLTFEPEACFDVFFEKNGPGRLFEDLCAGRLDPKEEMTGKDEFPYFLSYKICR